MTLVKLQSVYMKAQKVSQKKKLTDTVDIMVGREFKMMMI